MAMIIAISTNVIIDTIVARLLWFFPLALLAPLLPFPPLFPSKPLFPLILPSPKANLQTIAGHPNNVLEL